MGRRVHFCVCHDVTFRHRYWHQRGGGSFDVRSSNSGHSGRAGCRDIYLHHLYGNPAPRAQLCREADPQGPLHPARLHDHGSVDVSRLRSFLCSQHVCREKIEGFWCRPLKSPAIVGDIDAETTFSRSETAGFAAALLHQRPRFSF